jgi:hypothetical protein
LESDEKKAWKFSQGKLMNIELYLRQSCSRIPSSNIMYKNKETIKALESVKKLTIFIALNLFHENTK